MRHVSCQKKNQISEKFHKLMHLLVHCLFGGFAEIDCSYMLELLIITYYYRYHTHFSSEEGACIWLECWTGWCTNFNCWFYYILMTLKTLIITSSVWSIILYLRFSICASVIIWYIFWATSCIFFFWVLSSFLIWFECYCFECVRSLPR